MAGKKKGSRERGGGLVPVGRWLAQWAGAMSAVLPYAVSLGLLGALVGGSYAFAVQSDLFVLKKVTVVGRSLSEPDRFRLAGLVKGGPILTADLLAIQERIRRYFPEYQFVRVRRILPNEIRILLTERLAAARVRLSEDYLIDSSGVVLSVMTAGANVPVPLILGVPIPDKAVQRGYRIFYKPLEQAIRLLADIRDENILKNHRLSYCDISDPKNFVIVIDEKIEVRMGERNLPEKLGRLAEAILSDAIVIDADKVRYIDLRFDEVIVYPR